MTNLVNALHDGRTTLVVFPNWQRAAAFSYSIGKIVTRGSDWTHGNLTFFATDNPEAAINKAKGFDRVIFYQFSQAMKEWINDTGNRKAEG